MKEHYPALVVAYGAGLAGWLLVSRVLPSLWPRRPAEHFDHPWKEFGLALLGAGGVLAVGQLWTRGIRLPEDGPLGPLAGALNQLLIFAPLLLVPVLRRQPWTTAWLPRARAGRRLLVGVVLASVAVTAYSFAREGASRPWTILGRIARYEQLDESVQVLLEDVVIAILFVRLAAAIGKPRAVVLVACLFAAGHIPAMLAEGASWPEALGLLRDAGLGVFVILVLQRSSDVLWFWPIHFCLDMTQYARVSGAGSA